MKKKWLERQEEKQKAVRASEERRRWLVFSDFNTMHALVVFPGPLDSIMRAFDKKKD